MTIQLMHLGMTHIFAFLFFKVLIQSCYEVAHKIRIVYVCVRIHSPHAQILVLVLVPSAKAFQRRAQQYSGRSLRNILRHVACDKEHIVYQTHVFEATA